MEQINYDISTWLEEMLTSSAGEWEKINENFKYREMIYQLCLALATDAWEKNKNKSLKEAHRVLEIIYMQDFASAAKLNTEMETQPVLRDIAAILEKFMLRAELKAIDSALLDDMPSDGKSYVKWLKKLIAGHKSNLHPFYNDFLANHATKEHLASYITQESTLDPRFDDILAMMQIGLPVQQKMELANNYYDEMGNGKVELVHSSLFSQAMTALNIDEEFVKQNRLDAALVCGNVSAALALSRRHYFKAVGYYGVTEYMAPRRFKHVVNAWKRNNLPDVGIVYHDLHIVIDAGHANGWFNNVVIPSIDENPDVGIEIAQGALIRLNSSEKYLDQLYENFTKELTIA
ncbi:iron-containing redox enzyme family protein [Pantoea sp. Mb-10]|uniref:iron-containing redox enzyme family protein n=1 Tax=unclassified Pantoea TaxID=2630326 RepID=UPI001E48E167|nr:MULTISPECIES: iron-containing redox enzyme family protein [unclassified Pantoea]MCE0490296.1 iron-containing redox enzyme family protein [Pantoea sp. Mb-10]MCE0501427.1 iron-containing redox enzyme family protein [Pantoea sp. Pb-8]